MELHEITTVDYIIVGIYIAAMVLIGVYFVRKIKNPGDYYVAGHSFGPMVMMATVCATIIGGSGLMGRAGKAYSDGFLAIMTAVPYLIGMFIFSGISGRISDIGLQHDITSIPGLFEKRFGKTAKLILSLLIAFAMMGTVASQIRAAGTIFSLMGGDIGITYTLGAVIACIVFMLYTASSGLFGVVYTDVVQFYMLLVFVYILIPVSSLIKVGGWQNFTANLDPALITPYMNGSIAGDIVTYLVFTMAGAEMWQRAFAAKNRTAAKKGMFLGTSVYGMTIILVFFMGIIAHQILGNNVVNTDSVVPSLAIKVLPAGLTGLALAGLLSVIMSTADSYLLVSVQTCVQDIGKTLSPAMSDRREILLSRLFSIILPLGALLIALYIQNAYDILMFAWSFYAAAAGLPAFAALYWRKATTAGIISGMIAGFIVCVSWKIAGQPFGLGATLPGAIACAVVLFGVSLMTYTKHPSRFLEIKS